MECLVQLLRCYTPVRILDLTKTYMFDDNLRLTNHVSLTPPWSNFYLKTTSSYSTCLFLSVMPFFVCLLLSFSVVVSKLALFSCLCKDHLIVRCDLSVFGMRKKLRDIGQSITVATSVHCLWLLNIVLGMSRDISLAKLWSRRLSEGLTYEI